MLCKPQILTNSKDSSGSFLFFHSCEQALNPLLALNGGFYEIHTTPYGYEYIKTLPRVEGGGVGLSNL